MVYIFHGIPAPYRFPLFAHLNQLLNGDLEVCFLSTTAKNRRWDFETSNLFPFKVYPSLKVGFGINDWNEINLNWSLITRIFSFKSSDVVIVSGWLDITNQLAILLSKVIGYKVIIWSESTRYETSLVRTITLPYVRLLVKFAAGYIAIGTRSKEYLQYLGAAPDKINIALSAVDNNVFEKTDNQTKLTFAKSDWDYVLYVGQLIKRKNVSVLLQAINSIQSEHKVGLIIAGYGPLEAQLKAQAKKQNLKECHFLGNQSQAQLISIYKSASLLVLPSLIETWGLVVNEAMASGLPVVVSKRCGVSADLVKVGKNGYSFNPSDHHQLAKLIIKTLRNRKSFSATSVKTIKKASPEHAAESFYEQIKKLCA